MVQTLQQIAAAMTAVLMALSAQVGNIANSIPAGNQLAQVAAPTSGLVGHWKFNETSGTTAADSSGNGNTGTVSGATWTTGKVNNGLQFNGTSATVRANHSSSIGLTGNMTLSTWIKRSALSGTQILITKGDCVNNWLYQLFLNDANRLQFYTDGGGNSISSGSVTDTAWHHVAATKNGTAINFYIDGASAGSATHGASAVISNGDILSFGSCGGIAEYFSGALDEVRIYNRALSSSEISDIFNDTGTTPPPPPPPPTLTAPSISSFSASPSSITSGQSSILSWSVSGNPTPTLSINQSIGTVTGTSRSVSPTQTTTYTLTATNSQGSANANTTVTVSAVPPPPPPPPPPVTGTDFYVSPTGSASGNGSISNPWNLQTALNQPSGVQPGATIWLRGGTYSGNFSSNLNGTAASPITVRNYPGERPVLDGGQRTAITMYGNYTWIWGLEMKNSSTNPIYDFSYGVIVESGTGHKVINNIIHDIGTIGIYGAAVTSNIEIYGNVVYNVGTVVGPEGANKGGYGTYTQNNTGYKTFEDNLFLNNMTAYPIHIYGQAGLLNNISFIGNAMNGCCIEGRWVLMGSTETRPQNPVWRSNHIYSTGFDMGYVLSSTGMDNAIINDNYIITNFIRPFALNPSNRNTTMQGNRIYGDIQSFTQSQYPSNTYYASRPTGQWMIIRPNKYETGRGHAMVYTWDSSTSANLDLSQAGLVSGDTYEIRDAQNYLASPLRSGTYGGGSISVPVSGLSVATPVKVPAGRAAPTHSGPTFNVYVIIKTGSGSPPPPPPPPPPVNSTKFTVGERVQTTSNLNVRAAALASGTLLGTQSLGALGTIVSGGQSVDGFYWWNVNYDNAPDGYSVEDYLQAYTAPPAPIVGDFNNDGLVNSVDLSLLTSAWNTNNSTYDLNHDTVVNSLDYVIMVQNWSA